MLLIQFVIIAAAHFISVNGMDGVKVEINTDQIVSLRTPRENDRIVHKDAKCIIFLTDAKFIAVAEDCVLVRSLINDVNNEE